MNTNTSRTYNRNTNRNNNRYPVPETCTFGGGRTTYPYGKINGPKMMDMMARQ